MSCNPPSPSWLNYFNENTFLTTLTSFTFAIIGIFIFIFTSYIYFDKHKIPKGSVPTVPFGNFKDVLCQSTTLYDYTRRYYNRFKRKGYQYGGLYMFFKPTVVIVNLSLTKNIFGKTSESIGISLSDKHIIYFFETLQTNKDKLLASLQGNISLADSLYEWLLMCTKQYFGNLLDESLTDQIVKRRTTSSFKYFFKSTYPFFTRKISLDKLKLSIEKELENRKKNDVRIGDILNSFSGEISLEDNLRDVVDLFASNIAYAQSSLLLGLYELADQEDIQEDLVGEIRRFNKEDRDITMEILEQLPYLDVVIKEILRKYPPAPVVYEHFREGYENRECNVKLPKNIVIIAPILGIHRDPTFYSDPESFDPDRFTEDKTFMKADAYIPFGYGPMANISSRLAVISMKMIMFNILSNNRILKTSALSFDNKKLNMYPKEPLPIKLECID